jgi:hypothetical protein
VICLEAMLNAVWKMYMKFMINYDWI